MEICGKHFHRTDRCINFGVAVVFAFTNANRKSIINTSANVCRQSCLEPPTIYTTISVHEI